MSEKDDTEGADVTKEAAQEDTAALRSLRLSEILQSSVMVAGIAVAFAAVLPELEHIGPDLPILGKQYPLVPILLLLSGLFALFASYHCANQIRREARLSRSQLFLSAYPICWLCNSLLILSCIYAVVLWGIASRAG